MYISVIDFHRDMEIYIIYLVLKLLLQGKVVSGCTADDAHNNSGPGGSYHTYGRSLRSIRDLAVFLEEDCRAPSTS